MDGATLFLRLWLQRPLQIAAVCPNGEHLAGAIARLADFDQPGVVLELGAGAGSLTAGLLEGGCPIEQLVVLEYEPSLVAVLRRRFTGIRLRPGGRFMQITYAFSSPLASKRLGLAGSEAARVWRNLPPAQIWAYRRAGEM